MGEAPKATYYQRIGEDAVIRGIVGHFYDLMETEPSFAALRSMHAPDLGPMRERLAEFLSAWLGGPQAYFQRKNARCMSMVHAPFPIDDEVRGQWLACMDRALDAAGVSAELQAPIRQAFARMSEDMVNR